MPSIVTLLFRATDGPAVSRCFDTMFAPNIPAAKYTAQIGRSLPSENVTLHAGKLLATLSLIGVPLASVSRTIASTDGDRYQMGDGRAIHSTFTPTV